MLSSHKKTNVIMWNNSGVKCGKIFEGKILQDNLNAAILS